MPPSRTRHLVSNIRIKNDNGSEIEVQSNFLCYRTRMEKDQDLFVGTRHDLLRSDQRQLQDCSTEDHPGSSQSGSKKHQHFPVTLMLINSSAISVARALALSPSRQS